jgi:hypothetical protein
LKRWTTDGASFTEYRKIWCVVQMLLQPKTHKSLKCFHPRVLGMWGGENYPHLPFFFFFKTNRGNTHVLLSCCY